MEEVNEYFKCRSPRMNTKRLYEEVVILTALYGDLAYVAAGI